MPEIIHDMRTVKKHYIIEIYAAISNILNGKKKQVIICDNPRDLEYTTFTNRSK